VIIVKAAEPRLRYGTVRVVMCVPAYAPAFDSGGPVTKIQLLAGELKKLGVDIEILTANFGPGRSHIEPGRREVEGIPVTYLRRIASRGWVSVAPGAGRFIRGGNFHVVHCFGLRDGLVTSAAFAAGRARIPLVLEPMGMAVPRVRSLVVKRVFDGAVRMLVREPSVTLATSELEAGELRSLGYADDEVRYNPIALATSPPQSSKQYDLCFIGRLHEKKQLPAIAQILAQRPQLTAIVAGPDEDGSGAELAAAADRLGVTDRLTRRGWVTPGERDELLASSACFILPSLTENFGNAAAEALQAGVPVVVTDACGIAELVRTSGAGVVTSVARDDIVRDTVAFLDDPEAVGRAAAVTRQTVATLRPSAIAAAQLSMYERITRSG
jgi:glycosyltransferase involved in cell wall biosynthesis